MRSYIISIELYVWLSVTTRYTHPKTPPTDLEGIQHFGYNAKDVNAILVGLTRPVFAKVMHCKTTNKIWDILQTIYEGDTKVKRAKLQTFKFKLEV